MQSTLFHWKRRRTPIVRSFAVSAAQDDKAWLAARLRLLLLRHHLVAFRLELRAGQPARIFFIVRDLKADFEE